MLVNSDHGDSFYHVCFAVPDLRAAMDELTTITGARWGTPVHDRLGDWPYSLVFTDRPPHIELISSVEGSPWHAPTPQFHHLGWWTSCLPDADITDSPLRDTATMYFDGRPFGRHFVYLDAPHSGARIEQVDRIQQRSFIDRWTREPPDSEHPRRL
ncbi:VOC family protein [Nocardia aurantia]|uniref:VOC domain-containing protein n=1 Tax=Nocardia aurantia TaxID=2585199 RepID=A0A7K0E1E6_9NOCA|nr:VOC family protein [Nocardia aurantia]MQY31910.1 hypothetical protein [Nocardia aurantia]